MSDAAPQILHENEAQRQHIRVEIPAQATINGKDYEVHDVSVGGLRVKNVSGSFKKNQTFDCALTFPFEGFMLQVNIPCLVETYDSKEKTLGGKYSELTTAQLSILNLVIKSRMAGTLITESDLLHIAGRDNTVKFRADVNNDNTEKSKIKKNVTLGLILLAGFLGLAFIIGNVYESVSVLKSYQGVVQTDTIISRANVDGEFKSLITEDIEQITKGQPLAEISSFAVAIPETSEGAENPPIMTPVKTTIYSPCDCFVMHRFVNDGEFRALGESLFKLVPIDARAWVKATILPEDAQRLNFQDAAKIRIAGETTFIEGNVMNFNATNDDVPTIQVRVRPKTKLPNEFIGRPAYIEFMVY